MEANDLTMPGRTGQRAPVNTPNQHHNKTASQPNAQWRYCTWAAKPRNRQRGGMETRKGKGGGVVEGQERCVRRGPSWRLAGSKLVA
eukprot:scaffold146960_cov30-Tisochrysis_lutea.AAC.8